MIKSDFNNWISTYLNRRMLVVFMLGFSSGLPLALIGGTLQAWFKTAGASMILIGFTTLIGQPYSYKYLWAPLLDKYAPTTMVDRRRSWMIMMQLLIIGTIIAMAMFSPQAMIHIFKWDVPVLFLLGLFLSTCSATQDIAIDAYRIEILKHDERGLGAALGIEGYRLAMIASGGFALILADKIGWQSTYLWMAGLMLIGVLATAIAPPAQQATEKSVGSLPDLIVISFKDFLLRKKAWLILLLIVLYKLGDAFSHALSSTFLLDLNFSLTEVGMINKVLGVVASLIGVFVGGLFMTRVGLYRALLYFGILAAVTNLSYMVLALVGKNFEIACGAVFIENICAGMGTAAFVALIMSLCNKNYTATQYALLSSLTALGRTYVGPVSGYMVHAFGWAIFYGFSAAVAIPGLLLLIYLRKQIERRDVDSAAESVVAESSIRADTVVNEASQFSGVKA
ncbi:MAG TPA: MFS transporter [Gammaproteobacteria bacterium]|nr:MFS transporter [Gammaproteobacteria bacterium]